ncbi:hypothetical protein JTB14_022315 [Gonioctena quinquepunctata]|nr:hypothetical protein JTB14_022315 [Gonioctena quinquepunctata]
MELDYLRRHCDDSNYLINAPNNPTHLGPHRPVVLDIALIKNSVWDIGITSIPELSSDHNPLKIEYGNGPPNENNRYYKVTNWKNFTHILRGAYCTPVNVLSPQDLDIAVNKFVSTIQNAVKDSTIENPNRSPSHNALPPLIKNKIEEKNRARRTYQRTLAGNDKTILNNLVQEVISDFKHSNWSETLGNLDPKDPNGL